MQEVKLPMWLWDCRMDCVVTAFREGLGCQQAFDSSEATSRLTVQTAD